MQIIIHYNLISFWWYSHSKHNNSIDTKLKNKFLNYGKKLNLSSREHSHGQSLFLFFFLLNSGHDPINDEYKSSGNFGHSK